jgi:uncharacterized protein YbjT (DUF2867 family)
MANRILVTGARGDVGRELVQILTGGGDIVRVGTREPEVARSMLASDVEVVELDYDRTETYDGAVQWVDRMFLMPPAFDPDAYDTLGPFLDWAVSTDVRQVVLLSAMDAESMPELALRKVEIHLEQLGIRYTILRPNLYMQNFSSGFLLDSILANGAFELCAGPGSVSFVDVRDVAAVAAAALRSRDHDGRAYTLTGPESLGLHQIATILAEASGRAIAYRAVNAERMRRILHAAHWPERQAVVAAALFNAVAAGRREAVRADLAEVLGREPIHFREFAGEFAHCWRQP